MTLHIILQPPYDWPTIEKVLTSHPGSSLNNPRSVPLQSVQPLHNGDPQLVYMKSPTANGQYRTVINIPKSLKKLGLTKEELDQNTYPIGSSAARIKNAIHRARMTARNQQDRDHAKN